jgi:hypothetical protein
LKTALDAEGIELSVWYIHRKIGMSGSLFTNQLLREIEVEIDPERIELLRRGHAEAYQRPASEIRPLPGARKLLVWLIQAAIPWAIATSSRKTAAVNLAALTYPRPKKLPSEGKAQQRPRLKRWSVPADTPPACRTLNLLSDTGSYRWPRLRKLTS